MAKTTATQQDSEQTEAGVPVETTRISTAHAFTRRRFFGAAAGGVAAIPLGLFELDGMFEAVTEAKTGAEQMTGTDKTAVRSFQFNFTDAELADLRRRINATKWPEREQVSDASQGVQLATMQKLARYWGTDYDW